MYNEPDNDSLLELYMFEATTLLDRLEAAAARVKAGEAFSRAEETDIKRIMATIKGSSELMRFDVIADIAFETENMLSSVSSVSLGERDSIRLAEVLAHVVAGVRVELEQIQQGEPAGKRPEALFAELAGFGMSDISGAGAAKAGGEEPEITPQAASEADVISAPRSIADPARHLLHIYFYEDSRMENVRAYLLTDKLTKIGDVVAAYPLDIENDTDAAEYIRENGYYLALDTTMFREQLETMLKGTLSVESVSFTSSMPGIDASAMPEPAPQNPPEISVAAAPKPSAPQKPETTRQKSPAPPIMPSEAAVPLAPVASEIMPQTEMSEPQVARECLQVLLGGERYAVPVSCVRESFVAEESVGATVVHRGSLYSYCAPGELLGITKAAACVADGVLLLVSAGEGEGCLLVDKIIGTAPLTCAALPPFFSAYETRTLGVSGCALNDEHEISLLLDPATFFPA